jgi:hypothetical protein
MVCGVPKAKDTIAFGTNDSGQIYCDFGGSVESVYCHAGAVTAGLLGAVAPDLKIKS